MSEPTSGQSGGIVNSGTMNTGGGDAVGRDKTTTTTTTYYSPTEIHNAWQPVADAIRTASPEKQAEATAKLDDLKKEVAKGKAEDTTIAKLVKGLVGLVPSAVSAVAGAFGTPILSGVAGPVTKFVLDELGEGKK